MAKKEIRISDALNMKGSRKMVLIWQTDLSKWNKREVRMGRIENVVKLEVIAQEEKTSEGKK